DPGGTRRDTRAVDRRDDSVTDDLMAADEYRGGRADSDLGNPYPGDVADPTLDQKDLGGHSGCESESAPEGEVLPDASECPAKLIDHVVSEAKLQRCFVRVHVPTAPTLAGRVMPSSASVCQGSSSRGADLDS